MEITNPALKLVHSWAEQSFKSVLVVSRDSFRIMFEDEEGEEHTVHIGSTTLSTQVLQVTLPVCVVADRIEVFSDGINYITNAGNKRHLMQYNELLDAYIMYVFQATSRTNNPMLEAILGALAPIPYANWRESDADE
jgi:hypothetical protein